MIGVKENKLFINTKRWPWRGSSERRDKEPNQSDSSEHPDEFNATLDSKISFNFESSHVNFENLVSTSATTVLKVFFYFFLNSVWQQADRGRNEIALIEQMNFNDLSTGNKLEGCM